MVCRGLYPLPAQHMGGDALPQTHLGGWTGWHPGGLGHPCPLQHCHRHHHHLHVGSVNQWLGEGRRHLLHDFPELGTRVWRIHWPHVHCCQFGCCLDVRPHVHSIMKTLSCRYIIGFCESLLDMIYQFAPDFNGIISNIRCEPLFPS